MIQHVVAATGTAMGKEEVEEGAGYMVYFHRIQALGYEL